MVNSYMGSILLYYSEGETTQSERQETSDLFEHSDFTRGIKLHSLKCDEVVGYTRLRNTTVGTGKRRCLRCDIFIHMVDS